MESQAEESVVPSIFYDDELVADVIGCVKSGKEATVYCCEAHPSMGVELLAVKIYRSAEHRNFRNSSIYEQGRVVSAAQLTSPDAAPSERNRGKKYNDRRYQRAVKKKSRAGRALQAASWAYHEYDMLTILHAAGADVPRPFAYADNAIAMEWLGEGASAAPRLKDVSLPQEEAEALLKRILSNVELWLAHGVVHGDLSPFNILYHERTAKVIDFPQAIDARTNPFYAPELLGRDIDNVCKHFARYGVRADPAELADELRMRYFWDL